MNAIDLRNAKWADLQDLVQGLRLTVLNAWRQHGPCTTRQLAQRSGLDLLTVRPRTTELIELFLVEIVGREGTEGIYQARPETTAKATFDAAREAALGGHQPELALKP